MHSILIKHYTDDRHAGDGEDWLLSCLWRGIIAYIIFNGDYWMDRKKQNRIIILVIVEVMIVALIVGIIIFKHSQVKRGDSSVSNNKKEIEAVEDSENAESSNEPLSTLLFASDYQYENGWDAPKDTLRGVIESAKDDGKVITGVIMCGDYSNEYKKYDYQISPEDSIEEIKELVPEECSAVDSDDILFVQGNHDALTDSISETGLHEYDDYLVYVLNTQNDFPWSQGKTVGALDKVRRSSEELKDCLNKLIEEGETRPVFIAGHVPLHYTARTSSKHTTGDNLYSSLIFDVVNDAGNDLDIVYLVGHNHSKGWDCYLGGSSLYKASGDTILIPEFDENEITSDSYSERTLSFTYLNAGYVGYYMNCGSDELESGMLSQYDAADMTLTGTVCEVYSDKLVLTRYDTIGVHELSHKGEGDPYKGGIDAGLISSDQYSARIDSPQEIVRNAA